MTPSFPSCPGDAHHSLQMSHAQVRVVTSIIGYRKVSMVTVSFYVPISATLQGSCNGLAVMIGPNCRFRTARGAS
jgi:hypothetical protein